MQKRKTSIKVPQFIKILAIILEKINSNIAMKFVLYFFYKPIKFNRPKREQSLYEKAEKDFFIYKDKKVRYYQWGSSGKKVLFAHGWSGRGTQLNLIIEAFISSGYSVYSFDAPAHGDSDGSKTHMLQLVECIEKMNHIANGFDFIAGHSMGGLACLNAINRGVEVKKVAIIGTPNLIENVISDFCMNMGLGDSMLFKIRKFIEDKYNSDVYYFSGEYIGEKIDIPLLIIHDKNDVDVLYSEAESMKQKISKSILFTTEGLGHRQILASEKVIDKLIEFADC